MDCQPLTDEEWRAFINEYNGAMSDVETDLRTALETLGLRIQALVNRGELHVLEADSLYETLRESLLRAQDRLNAHARRLLQMRVTGEL